METIGLVLLAMMCYSVIMVLVYSICVLKYGAKYIFEKDDKWIGYFNDRKRGKKYIFMVPTFGICFEKKNTLKHNFDMAAQYKVLESHRDEKGNLVIDKCQLSSISQVMAIPESPIDFVKQILEEENGKQ